jgi:hypothetical protein
MPGLAAASTGHPAEDETARGGLDPGTYAVSDRYAVNLSAGWPGDWRDWKGASGAAVRCEDGGHLVGVAAWADKPLQGRRLTAVPACALLADAGFAEVIARHLGRVPQVEPVELAAFLSRRVAAGSPGGLLRADAALVGFTGREEELRILENWQDDRAAPTGPDVKAFLLTGRGGEGKTRLAIEFAARSRRAGWTGGLLRAGASPADVAIAVHCAGPRRAAGAAAQRGR